VTVTVTREANLAAHTQTYLCLVFKPRAHVHILEYKHSCIYMSFVCTCMYKTYIHTYICICRVYIHVCGYIHAHTCMPGNAYPPPCATYSTYYTYIHTHIHTYIRAPGSAYPPRLQHTLCGENMSPLDRRPPAFCAHCTQETWSPRPAICAKWSHKHVHLVTYVYT
jgi:hypothetical protein